MKPLRIGLASAAALVGAGAIFARGAARRLERRYRPRGRMAPVTGGRLHLVDIGPRGERAKGTVLLLHGACGNLADMTLALGGRLADTYRVIAVDRPGHGWSDRPGGARDASPARQARLIRQALDAIGVDEAIVVGHSWSGGLAAHFALAHRGFCRGLVLVAAATHPWPGGVAWYYMSAAAAPLVSGVFTHALVPPIGLAAIEGAVKAIFAPQRPVENYAELIGAGLLMRPAQFRANAQDMVGLRGFLAEQAPHYGTIDMPVELVHGTADRIVPDAHAFAFARQAPHARLTLLNGIGHMPHHVATGQVVAAIDRVAELADWSA